MTNLNARIGVLGGQSDWLVSSDVDYAAAFRNWGVSYIDIPLSEVEDRYKALAALDERAEEETLSTRFLTGSKGIVEPKRDDLRRATRLYLAIRDIVSAYRLDAITVKCFDLIGTTNTTGCLALALLDDNGIPAGCEGDLQSIFTKLLVWKVTGQPSFMANPALIRPNEVLVAHCTIGLNQVNDYIIRSHFESGKGVAIQGILPEGETYTIVKFGGKNLERRAVHKALLIENQNDANKCRTQVLLRTKDNSLSNYLLSDSIGNHHILVKGDWTKQLNEI